MVKNNQTSEYRGQIFEKPALLLACKRLHENIEKVERVGIV